MVTRVPTTPLVGVMETMVGPGTVKFRFRLLKTLPSAIHTRPDVAPIGTVVEIEVSVQFVNVAVVPLKLKLLPLPGLPNPLPVI
jgi:hypothetical protein